MGGAESRVFAETWALLLRDTHQGSQVDLSQGGLTRQHVQKNAYLSVSDDHDDVILVARIDDDRNCFVDRRGKARASREGDTTSDRVVRLQNVPKLVHGLVVWQEAEQPTRPGRDVSEAVRRNHSIVVEGS